MAKVKIKAESVGVRMPSKLRYGLELLARRNGLTLSGQIIRAAENLLEQEGLTAKQAGAIYTRLDVLWSQNEAERLLALCQHAPELSSGDEQAMATLLSAIKQSANREELKKELGFVGTDLILGPESAAELTALAEEMLAMNPKLAAEFKEPGSFLTFIAEWIPK
jgi:hypothetical protein